MNQFPLESSIIKAVMHYPEFNHKIFVSPNWFPSTNFRAIFKAVTKYPAPQGPDVWDKEAKDYGYKGQYHAVEALYEAKCSVKTVAQYNQYANSLERDYANSMIQRLSVRNHKRPSQETLDKIINFAVHAKDIENNETAPKDSMDKAVTSVKHDMKHDKQVGILSYPNLDNALQGGLAGGTLITIAASTGVGKTAYAVNLAYEILRHEQKSAKRVRIDFFSLEMPGRQVLNRFLSRASGCSNWQLVNPHARIHSPEKRKQIEGYAQYFEDNDLHIYTDQYDLSEILSTIRHNAQNRKPNTYIAIVDYIGLVSVDDAGPTASRSFVVGHVARELHNLTNYYNIPIIELAQLNRNPAMRDDQDPVLTDIRESGAIAQHSNVVILLSRYKKLNKRLQDTSQFSFIKARIAKNRSGLQCTIPYLFMKGQMMMLEDNMIIQAEKKHRLNKDWFDKITKGQFGSSNR